MIDIELFERLECMAPDLIKFADTYGPPSYNKLKFLKEEYPVCHVLMKHWVGNEVRRGKDKTDKIT